MIRFFFLTVLVKVRFSPFPGFDAHILRDFITHLPLLPASVVHARRQNEIAGRT